MKTGAVVAIVAGALVLIFWATSRGLIQSGVAVGPGGTQRGIVAPQPAQNYSGYLAATTAPQVSGLLNTAISGLNNAFSSWFGKGSATPVAPAQGVTSGTFAVSPAAPSGPVSGPNTANQNFIAGLAPATYSDPGSTLIGPQITPDLAYSGGSAFDYAGLSAGNGYDPAVSLELAQQGVYL